jgi:hypothetical protein
MNEKIIRVEEGSFQAETEYKYNDNFEGYLVVTDKQTIKVGIQSGQSCCEQYGYLASEDDLSKYEGATLLGMKLTDKELRTYTEEEIPEYESSCMFVDFETDKGVLQLVCYNSHNGYYGHSAVLISRDLNNTEYL